MKIPPNETTVKSDVLDGTEAVKFLKKLRPKGPWILTAIVDDKRIVTRSFTDLDAAQEFVCDHNGDGFNLYYSPNPMKGLLTSKAAKGDIAAVAYHHVDADPRPEESPEGFKARMEPIITKFKPRPTFVVDSGNGLQLLWERERAVKLTSPDLIAEMEAINHALAVALDADPATRNIDRVLRLPGTVNYPNARKLKLGRTECQAVLLEYNDLVYRDEDFPPRHVEPERSASAAEPRKATALPPRAETILHLVDPDAGPYNTRSGALWAFLMTALGAGVSDDAIVAACLDRRYVGKSVFEHVREKGGRQYLLRQIARAVTKVPQSSSAFSWDAPDTSLLDDRRGELPDFPLDCLPEPLRPVVTRVAVGAGVLPDHVALPLLGITSSLIGAARRVRASKSWSQPLTSWSALVGFSAEGKTPALDAIKRPLDDVQAELQKNNDTARKEHKERAETAAALKAVWLSKVKAAAKENQAPPAKPQEAEEPEPFVAPRLYAVDITIERMAQLLQVRPRGMLLLEDELAGLFANLSRYSRGDDKAFWLKCWNGGAHSVERKTLPPIEVPNLLVGIVGGMQPDKLADCFKGAADGMYARFLYAWPRPAPYRPMSADAAEIDDDLANALDALAKLDDLKPPSNRVGLSKQAREVFEEVRRLVYGDRELYEGRARDWWAKVPAHVLRLTGTLAYLDYALAEPGEDEPSYIAARFVADAAELVLDYFWPHAQACLRQIGLTQRHADARRVLRWLKAKGDLRQVSREEIRRGALGKQRDADATAEILAHLTRAGWLRPLSAPSGEKGGRPALRWEVNPRLLKTTEE